MIPKNYDATDIVKTRNALIKAGTPRKPFSLDPTPFAEKAFDFARFSAPVRRQPQRESPSAIFQKVKTSAAFLRRPRESPSAIFQKVKTELIP